VAYSEKRGWLGKVYFGMELKTTTVWGYLRFWGLAKLKRFRPKSWRFAEEQAVIEAGSRASSRPRSCRAISRSKSPNARG
jgi:indolepyruvate ferredoxin oxidoreductase beta subunit